MMEAPAQITLDQWDLRYENMRRSGVVLPAYCGPLSNHVSGGDLRLRSLLFDNSAAAFRLWSFLLTEDYRLQQARDRGMRLVGSMKDLGTVPVLAYSLENLIAFYPDGAWWTPCIMETSSGLLEIADSLGVDESFCPVRAMLGAFVMNSHFPIPDLLTCSAGAVCDDFSAIAQRLEALGFPILWWELPHRRRPEDGDSCVELPGGFVVPGSLVEIVKAELERVRAALQDLAGRELDEIRIGNGIRAANRIRALLTRLRDLAYCAEIAPIPSLEMMIAEMLAIHFCSDRSETLLVLEGLVSLAQARADAHVGFGDAGATRIFWINPVADLKAMNLVEQCGGRICGTDYLFMHALDQIPENIPPMEALARMALSDPMAGSSADRAERICRDIRHFGSEAVVISRIPGASHCALEGRIIGEIIRERVGAPVLEIEVPSLTEGMSVSIRTRLEALVETAKEKQTA